MTSGSATVTTPKRFQREAKRMASCKELARMPPTGARPASVRKRMGMDADQERADTSEWTAKEHAALRGHISIARLLAARTVPRASDPNLTNRSRLLLPPCLPLLLHRLLHPPPHTLPYPQTLSLTDRKSNGTVKSTSPSRAPQTVKTFGHRRRL